MRVNLLRSIKLLILLAVALAACQSPQETPQAPKPNIILIYIDDLGYGDVSCYGAFGVQTPNIDQLAKSGVQFTDGHCSASTCTPSRYSLLTGRYAFRNKASILAGDAPLIIADSIVTLPERLKTAGYKTGVVGKWHLGLGDGSIDWNQKIAPGPLESGFDYSFLIPATGDRVPTVFVENHFVVGLDPNDPITVSYDKPIEGVVTGDSNPELRRWTADPQHNNTIVNGVSRIGYMKGGKAALWVDEEFPNVLSAKAAQFIESSGSQPFFLYYAFPDIHVPRVPNERFAGKSGMGPRGDVILQMDWMVGELMATLKAKGLTENTMIIFTSDNGPILADGYDDSARELIGDHKPGGVYRGGKYSIFEAGTRVPTIVSWPGGVQPGVSDALVSQVDLFASLAKLAGCEPLATDYSDSEDQLDAWLGKSATGRTYLVEEAFTMGLRFGNWKYIKPGKGAEPVWLAKKFIEPGFATEPQLYNLETDPGERINVAAENPELVEKLQQELESIINKQ